MKATAPHENVPKYLTPGKEYDVIKMSNGIPVIVDDEGDETLATEEHFDGKAKFTLTRKR